MCTGRIVRKDRWAALFRPVVGRDAGPARRGVGWPVRSLHGSSGPSVRRITARSAVQARAGAHAGWQHELGQPAPNNFVATKRLSAPNPPTTHTESRETTGRSNTDYDPHGYNTTPGRRPFGCDPVPALRLGGGCRVLTRPAPVIAGAGYRVLARLASVNWRRLLVVSSAPGGGAIRRSIWSRPRV